MIIYQFYRNPLAGYYSQPFSDLYGNDDLSFGVSFNDSLKFVHILATPEQPLDISFKLGISPDRAHTFKFPDL